MSVHLGFSYVGFIFLLMLLIPNIIWSRNKPNEYDQHVKNENRLLLLFERIGEILVTCLSLIFCDFNMNKISGWSGLLYYCLLLF